MNIILMDWVVRALATSNKLKILPSYFGCLIKKKKLEKCIPSLRTHHWFIRESEIFCWSWIAPPTCWKGHLSDCSSQVQRKGICSFSWGRPHSTSAYLTSIQKLPPEEMDAETDVRTEGGALGEAGSGNNRKCGSSVYTHSFPKWFGSQHSALSKSSSLGCYH